MNVLKFDFTESATRATIIAQLRAALELCGIEDDFEGRVRSAGVPDKHHHDYAEVLQTIDDLDQVSDRVRSDMRGIYLILTEAEAKAHGVSLEKAHFHEVGNASGIEGVLLVCMMVEALSPERIVASDIQVGSGTVRCAHGELEVPAPATANVIARGIPVRPERLDGELCTPTSAAMILRFVDEFAV